MPKKVEFWDLVEQSLTFQSEYEKGLPAFQEQDLGRSKLL
jgi:hypothetical protein